MCRSSLVLHITKMSGWGKFVGSNSILWEVFFSGAGWDENVGGQTTGLNMGYTVYSIPPTGHWEDDAHPWDLGASTGLSIFPAFRRVSTWLHPIFAALFLPAVAGTPFGTLCGWPHARGSLKFEE